MFQQTFSHFSHYNLYFTTYLSWPDKLYLYCFSGLKYVDPYYHYAACCVPLIEAPKWIILNFNVSYNVPHVVHMLSMEYFVRKNRGYSDDKININQ